MGTKSAIIMPEPYWLLEELPVQVATIPMRHEVFFSEIDAWDLSAGMRISALRGAMFVFDFFGIKAAIVDKSMERDFERRLAASQARVELINAFSYCLHSARVDKENLGGTGFRVAPHELIHMDDESKSMGGDSRGFPPVVHALDLQQVPPVYLGYAPRVFRVGVIPEVSIQRACEILDLLLSHNFPKAIGFAALLNESIVAYNSHYFSSSLVTSWTICEALLQHKWKRYFEESASSSIAITKARREFLIGRDFTASVVIENLAVAGEITVDLYSKLGVARKARNNWIHGQRPTAPGTAATSLQAATALLTETLGLPLRLGTGGVGLSAF